MGLSVDRNFPGVPSDIFFNLRYFVDNPVVDKSVYRKEACTLLRDFEGFPFVNCRSRQL